MIATLTASPMTVQVLALVAAVLFLAAAIVALSRPQWRAEVAVGLLCFGLVALSVAVVYLV